MNELAMRLVREHGTLECLGGREAHYCSLAPAGTPLCRYCERLYQAIVSEVEVLLLQRAQEIAKLEAEIAEAREACPSIRRQDYFDAPLLKLIELEVSRGFNRDAEIAKLSDQLTARAQEIEQVKAEVEHQIDVRRNQAAEMHRNAQGSTTLLGAYWEGYIVGLDFAQGIYGRELADAALVSRAPQQEKG